MNYEPNNRTMKFLTLLVAAAVFALGLSLDAGYYEIQAMHSGKCLDVPRSSNRNAVKIIQYTPYQWMNQLWKVTEGPTGYYEIQAMHSGKCLDVPRSSRFDRVGIIQYRCSDTTNQRWRLTEGPPGYYRVRAMHSGKCLDVLRSSTANGGEVIQYRCAATTNQRWKFIFRKPLAKPHPLNVVAVSLGGSSSTDIHGIVAAIAREEGNALVEGRNWVKDKGDWVAGNSDARRIRNHINNLASRNGGNKSNLSLLVVGKSAGGVLAWNTFKRHYGDLDDFARVTLVLVDPHGSVWGDGRWGPYSKRQDLWWPSSWTMNTDLLRVYDIYQYRDWPWGASFPDRRVYRNIYVNDGRVTHDNIPGHQRTRDLIRAAMDFAILGRHD